MLDLLAMVLRKEGYEVEEYRNGVELLDSLYPLICEGKMVRADLVISDIRMPGVTGLEVLEGLNRSPSAPPMILITAFGDIDTQSRSRRMGAAALLSKPFEMDRLISLVHEIAPLPPGDPAVDGGTFVEE